MGGDLCLIVILKQSRNVFVTIERSESAIGMSALATRDDVLDCYMMILRRGPENDRVVADHLADAPTIWELVARFVHSDEFTNSIWNFSSPLEMKYFQQVYLAHGLDQTARFRAYLHNYAYLAEGVTTTALHELMFGEKIVWRSMVGEHFFSITASITSRRQHEGELSLWFNMDNEKLFILSFTFVPGDILGLSDRHVMLISRMQGAGGRFSQIRYATKCLHEVHPQAALLAVARGIATACDLDRICGVPARRQLCFHEDLADSFRQAYDQFFVSIGAEKNDAEFFVIAVRLAEKPLSALKPSHRRRARIRRRFKADMSSHALAAWRDLLHSVETRTLYEERGDLFRKVESMRLASDTLNAEKALLMERVLSLTNEIESFRKQTWQEIETLNAEKAFLAERSRVLATDMESLREKLARSDACAAAANARNSMLLETNTALVAERDETLSKLHFELARPNWLSRILIDHRFFLLNKIAICREQRRLAKAGFDGDYYLDSNPDVAASGMNPVLHFLLFGRREQRPMRLASKSEGRLCCKRREVGVVYE